MNENASMCGVSTLIYCFEYYKWRLLNTGQRGTQSLIMFIPKHNYTVCTHTFVIRIKIKYHHEEEGVNQFDWVIFTCHILCHLLMCNGIIQSNVEVLPLLCLGNLLKFIRSFERCSFLEYKE